MHRTPPCPHLVRHHLPRRAQDLYREAFNDAWASYARDQRREEIAHRTAWAAVKRYFHKGAAGQWEPNAHEGDPVQSKGAST